MFSDLGRPARHRSGNGPTFDSTVFTKYIETLGIERDPSYPFQPQSIPVKMWMKSLGKCIKIVIKNNFHQSNEKEKI